MAWLSSIEGANATHGIAGDFRDNVLGSGQYGGFCFEPIDNQQVAFTTSLWRHFRQISRDASETSERLDALGLERESANTTRLGLLFLRPELNTWAKLTRRELTCAPKTRWQRSAKPIPARSPPATARKPPIWKRRRCWSQLTCTVIGIWLYQRCLACPAVRVHAAREKRLGPFIEGLHGQGPSRCSSS